MSNDINKACLLGNIGKEPTMRTWGADEKPIVKFTMATNNRYKSKESGEYEDDTTWHNVVCFNKYICEQIMKRAQVGTRLYIEGEIKTRSYEKDGQTRWITEIVIPQFEGACKFQGKTKDSFDSGSATPAAPDASNPDDDFPF